VFGTALQILLIAATQKNEMCGACSLSGGEESYIHGLVGIPEGMRSLGKLDVDANIK